MKPEGQAEEKYFASAPSQKSSQHISCQIPSITGHRGRGDRASFPMEQPASLYTHNKQTNKECFLVQWNTGNFFQVLSCWLQYRLNSLWLCTAMYVRQVSISKLGLFEEPVLQFPGYYPLQSSIRARDFGKVFLSPRAFTEVKVRLCTNAKWCKFSARGHLRWLWQLEFPRGSTFCLSARGQGGAPVVLIPRTAQKTPY